MDSDAHVMGLGKLWANLNGVETLLRALLQNRKGLGHKYDLMGLKVGDTVPLDILNRFAYFSTLVDGFNALAKPEDKIPQDIVDLRNALAHGITLGKEMKHPIRLFKFGKIDKAKGTAQVEFADDMTEEWLAKKRREVYDVMMKIDKYTPK